MADDDKKSGNRVIHWEPEAIEKITPQPTPAPEKTLQKQKNALPIDNTSAPFFLSPVLTSLPWLVEGSGVIARNADSGGDIVISPREVDVIQKVSVPALPPMTRIGIALAPENLPG